MKRFIISLFVIATVLMMAFFTACKSENPLYSHVSELRQNIYEGQSQNYHVKAQYGYREHPFDNNAKVDEHVYRLIFKLMDKETDGATYTVNLTHGEEKYSSTFTLDPVTHSVTAKIEISDFNLNKFDIEISSSSSTEKVTMSSTLPENTIDYKTALDFLYQDQSALIESYTDQEGNLNLEIYERITVKNGKPYWYVGLASGNGNLKALLIDGISGQTLAIREIF